MKMTIAATIEFILWRWWSVHPVATLPQRYRKAEWLNQQYVLGSTLCSLMTWYQKNHSTVVRSRKSLNCGSLLTELGLPPASSLLAGWAGSDNWRHVVTYTFRTCSNCNLAVRQQKEVPLFQTTPCTLHGILEAVFIQISKQIITLSDKAIKSVT